MSSSAWSVPQWVDTVLAGSRSSKSPCSKPAVKVLIVPDGPTSWDINATTIEESSPPLSRAAGEVVDMRCS